jgi:hypothetical protein
LLTWRDGGEAGVLTIKAAGNLKINKNLSDGVVSVPDDLLGTKRDTAATSADQPNPGNWSYRLTAGADLSAADPMAVSRGVGDVTLGSGVKVRTGTGNIEIAAGRDLSLSDSTAAIYSVGENRGPGGLPQTSFLSPDQVQELLYNGDFLQNGGDIRIAVGRDVQGANGHQLVNDWLARVAGKGIDLFGESVSLPASWAVNLDAFQQNIGALGGGNVTVTAGGNVNKLSIVIPTTAQPVGGPGTAPDIAGGGDLRITAGGDIRGGVFYIGKGQADLQAGGSITHAQGETLYPVLALGEGQYALRARKDLTVEDVVNPTVLPTSTMQGAIDPNSGQPYLQPTPAYFFTYTPDSAVRLEALSGDVAWDGNTGALKSFSGNLTYGNSGGFDYANTLTYMPGTLSAHSLQGDIVIGGQSFTLLPTPYGNLELLAAGSITPGANASPTLLLSDADPAQMPGILTPTVPLTTQITSTHAATPVHQSDTDTEPSCIVAQTGDIGSPKGSLNQLTLVLSKQARIYAGGDVSNLNLSVQHANTTDISVVEAGGSVLFPTQLNASGKPQTNASLFEIAGPGQLYVIAGKDVDLGASSGIQSVGNLKNPALPTSGAAITVMAGQAQAPHYGDFITNYLVNSDAYWQQLSDFMGSPVTTADEAKAFFNVPLVQQRKFILQVLFNELRESGTAAVESKNYERGFAAINTLFPPGSYPGDIKSFLSQITTKDGGDINLVVPGGLVNAGIASSTVINKTADQLGIVAAREGGINAFAHGDFLVNQSRVFALDGGDILVWSSTGNIDAGKGAKTALSIPAAEANTDPNTGITTVEFPPPIQGSGIGTAVRTPGRKPGDVFLIAPVGVINAGDAGIASAGNLTIAATAVLGADNIQVAGAAVGVPTDTGGLGASLMGVSDIAATASKVAEDATRGLATQTNESQGFLGVEVLGFGE